jgi:RNA polymerase sigma-70 factor (ECF subfamily)
MGEPLRQLDRSRVGDHLTLLYRSAWSLCGNREQAEDLVQETYARVLARPRFMRNDDDLGYLVQALRNTYFAQLRKEKRQPRGDSIDVESDPIDQRGHMQPEREAESRELYAAIPQLPDDYRFALVAVDVTGLSYEEAAKALGVPVGTVRSRLFRAREKMAELLGDRPEQGEAAPRTTESERFRKRTRSPDEPRLPS